MTPTEVLAIVNRDKRPTRIEVAHAYADMLLTYWNNWPMEGAIAPLNNRIIERWSMAGLGWIKRAAWKRAEADVRMRAIEARHIPLAGR